VEHVEEESRRSRRSVPQSSTHSWPARPTAAAAARCAIGASLIPMRPVVS